MKAERDCYWEALGGFSKTKIYAWEDLKPGNLIQGPSVIEAEATTVVIEPEWTFKMDSYGNGILTYNK
jgi:N-methylhydantoinase A/oxoprolinase/acetone carboxylase beta subunit